MKTLYLIRHAKSSWDDPMQRDSERPLNHRGIRNAPVMAERWKQKVKLPVHWVSSNAVRARETAEIFADALGVAKANIHIEPMIYEASVNVLLEVINGFSDEHNHIVMFGHNPGFSLLVEYCTGHYISMPTCSIATIEFSIDTWKAVSADLGRLAHFDYPKKVNE